MDIAVMTFGAASREAWAQWVDMVSALNEGDVFEGSDEESAEDR